jgi:hypothetical protein
LQDSKKRFQVQIQDFSLRFVPHWLKLFFRSATTATPPPVDFN